MLLRRVAVSAVVLIVAAALGAFLGYELFEQPTNQIFGKTITSGPSNERVVALTFDDGPNPPYTTRILQVLEKEHVHATFFLVGRAVAAYPDVVRREVRDGDAVGNHTWEHRHLIVMTRTQVHKSLQRTNDAIYLATGMRTRLMRPPFGARDWIVMQVARKLGYTVVMWSVPLARDWEYPAPGTIARRVLPNVTDGSIIVLHDGNRGQLCSKDRLSPHVCDRSSDIEATKIIVDQLKREGYRFVTIPELISLGKGAKHTPAPGGE
jgi:peptidoglycan/xylan/chitin deacetylase (PgdA/CDA1 family)